MSEQIKKLPYDPDWNQINPELISLAMGSGKLKGPITLFLHGDLSWREALETMVLLLAKENRENVKLLGQALRDAPQVVMGLPYDDKIKHLKKLPPCQKT